MEEQKSKRGRKKKTKVEDQNQNAELFVLPPNLLEQLGIELGQTISKNQSIGSDTETCMNNNTGIDKLSSTPVKQSTSLSETASLTKKSIFLSPTFSHYDEPAYNGVEQVKNNDIPINDIGNSNSIQLSTPNKIEKDIFSDKVNGDIKRSQIKIISQEVIKPSDKLLSLLNTEDSKNIVYSQKKSPLISTNVTGTFQDKIKHCNNFMLERNKTSISDLECSMNDAQNQICYKNDTTFASVLQVNNIEENMENYNIKEIKYPEAINFEPAGISTQGMECEKVEKLLTNNVTSDHSEGYLALNDVKAFHSEVNINKIHNDFSEVKAEKSKEGSISNDVLAIQLEKNPSGDPVENSIKADHLKENPVLDGPQSVKLKEKPSDSNIESTPSKEKVVLNNLNVVQSVVKPVSENVIAVNSEGNKSLLEKRRRRSDSSNKNKQTCKIQNDVKQNEVCTSAPIATIISKSKEVRNQEILSPTPYIEDIVQNESAEKIAIQGVKSNVNNDNVQEIANYLSTLMKKKQLCNVNNKVIPKSSFHGVEKPGGLQVLHTSSCKTYQKKKHNSSKNNAENLQITYQDQFNKIIKSNNNINCEMPVPSIITQQTFCICSDFGHLSCDSEEGWAEHVHFENKITNIKLENIFETDDRLTNNAACDQVFNFESVSNNSEESEENNFHIICYATSTLEKGDEKYCDNNTVAENSNYGLNQANIENQTKFETESIPKIPVNKTSSSTREQTKNEESTFEHVKTKNNHDCEAGTSDAFKDIDNNEIYIYKNNTINQVDALVKEKRYSKSEKNVSTKEDTLILVSEKKTTSLVSKNDSGHEIVENISPMLSNPINIKQKGNKVESEKSGNKSQSDLVTTKDAVLQKKRQRSLGYDKPIEKQDIFNLLKDDNDEQPSLKRHKSDKIYPGRKRPSANVECTPEIPAKKSYKCDDCEEFIDDDTLAKHVQDKHSFIGFNLNPEKTAQCSDNVADTTDTLLTCGVCDESMAVEKWHKHIAEKHNYMAWKKNKRPLDLNDNEAIKRYLHRLCKTLGVLVCCHCGRNLKYAKSFMHHIKNCTGAEDMATMSKDGSVNDSVFDVKDTSVSEDLKEQNTSFMPKDQSTSEGVISNLNTTESTKNSDNETFKCGVCTKEVPRSKWMDHIFTEHDYIAWKENDTPLDQNDEHSIRDHLHNTAKEIGGLTCSKCGKLRKYAKSYMQHFMICTGPEDTSTISMDSVSVNDSVMEATLDTSVSERLTTSTTEQNVTSMSMDQSTSESFISNVNTTESTATSENGPYRCGVCAKEVVKTKWMDHIFTEHGYMAWKEGDKPLNCKSETAMRLHLHNVVKEIGSLTCSKCGTVRKYPKSFLAHIKECAEGKDTSSISMDVEVTEGLASVKDDVNKDSVMESDGNTMVKCGVCAEEVCKSSWWNHSFKKHQYLATIAGQPPLNLEDEEEVRLHLHGVSKQLHGLKCPKCGRKIKYAKNYIEHTKTCAVTTGIESEDDLPLSEEAQKQRERRSIVKEKGTEHTNIAGASNMCGVCKKEVDPSQWLLHIKNKHHYMAWKEGEKPLDLEDEEEIRDHLHEISKQLKGLQCYKCRRQIKYAKVYMEHVHYCDETIVKNEFEESLLEESQNIIESRNPSSEEVTYKCGVCSTEVVSSNWFRHIFKEHQYIAWKEGDTPINIEDEGQVRLHLHEITKQLNGLKCAKCGRKIKYAKNYMEHIKYCEGTGINEFEETLIEKSQQIKEPRQIREPQEIKESLNAISEEVIYKCGVCSTEVEGSSNWLLHIFKEHQYIAWKEGDTPLDIEDEEQVKLHLHDITKQLNGLKCAKCGRKIKYAKNYMEHIKICEPTGTSEFDVSLFDSPEINESRNLTFDEGIHKCGVCSKEVEGSSNWLLHIYKEHQYMAWREGDTPLDIEDEEQVRLHLHDITKQLNGLKCTKCRRKIKYAKNYMEHIKYCEADRTSEDDISLFEESLKQRESHSFITEGEGIISDKSSYKCGVCGTEVGSRRWMTHIFKEHQYLAWKDGDQPLNLDNDEDILHYLRGLSKQINGLQCSKCFCKIEEARIYMEHIKNCTGQANENEMSIFGRTKTEENSDTSVVCGVCQKRVKYSRWMSHIAKKHQYIAWQEGDPPLDLNNEEELRQHLFYISREFDGITCTTCERKMKNPKVYMEHVKTCYESESSHSMAASIELNKYFELDTSHVDCGICDANVSVDQWLDHIQQKHNYLAKKKGAKPLDTENQDEVLYHLTIILRALGSLTCTDCGLVRKYAKVFMHHLNDCDKSKSFPESLAESGASGVCAMCKKEVSAQLWRKHAMDEHYNIAWMIGQKPLNITSQMLVNKKLQEYLEEGNQFVCKVCGLLRMSEQGFFAHIMVCGKSEEDQEVFKVVCDICNEKYLFLNKYKHMKMHKDEQVMQEKMQKYQESENDCDTPDSGKRRAAQKAIKVIGNLTKNISGFKYTCEKCPFGSDSLDELNSHHCAENQNAFDSDNDDSVKSEALSDNESPESEIDSNVSAEEEQQYESDDNIVDEIDYVETARRKKTRIIPIDPNSLFPIGVKRPPFPIEDRKVFIAQNAKDYIENYFTDDVLYPEWRKPIYEVVSPEEVLNYLPPLEKSCHLNHEGAEICLKRFEAVMRPGKVLFTGGCIRSIVFAPTRLDDQKPKSGNFMAILCHKGSDEPKYLDTEIVSGPGLIQIWDFNNFMSVPELALGLVHDFGTIWACDWCPSGVRDSLPKDPEDLEVARLGLLAIACSNGSAYILSVPYASTVVKKENRFIRVNPVAELRMADPSKRQMYQATAIKWTPQNGHETVAVGYSGGYVAYYNLTQNSPLLTQKENGVTIYYPYHEERRHKNSISDIDIGALKNSTSDISTVSSASPSGCCVTSQSVAGFSARCVGINPADKCLISKVCPHVIVAGDYSAVNKCINEIEWWGAFSRRLAIQACTECCKCGALASYTSPVVKILKFYPLLDQSNARAPLKIIDLIPIGSKRKLKSDELGLVVEPRTYEEAIKKYGVGISKITNKRSVSDSQRSLSIDRFPLASVTSMHFCTSSTHHHKLALSIHAGFVIIIETS